MNSKSSISNFVDEKTWLSMRDSKSRLPREAGVYAVRSGHCVSHVGQSSDINTRVSQLMELRAHRASARVLCVAFCTGKPPQIYYERITSSSKRTNREKQLKQLLMKHGPLISKFSACSDGQVLRSALQKSASDWERGYIDAVFDIKEFLRNLFRPCFEPLWRKVGKPPGWEKFSIEDR
jgi:hypothetical protein